MLKWLEKDEFYKNASPMKKIAYKACFAFLFAIIGYAFLMTALLADEVYYPPGDRWQDIFTSSKVRTELREEGMAHEDNRRFLGRFGTMRFAHCPDPVVWQTFSADDKARYYKLKASFGWDASRGYGKKVNEEGCVSRPQR